MDWFNAILPWTALRYYNQVLAIAKELGLHLAYIVC